MAVGVIELLVLSSSLFFFLAFIVYWTMFRDKKED